MADNAGKIGETFVQIKADTDALRRDVSQLKRKMDGEARRMGNSFSNILSGAWGKLLAAGGVIYGLKKAFDFTSEFKNAARDAIETRNKFREVFSSISDIAENTAKDFAKSFDLANSTAQELLGSTGDLLVGFGFAESAALQMSVRVNQLAQDLASFQNFSGGAIGASEALTKAILGETESAKSLGIVIRQNTKEFRSRVNQLKQTKGLTDQQAKAVVILNEAYKQSSKAVGDYKRTRDELANSERRLNEQYKAMEEEIGGGLVPAFNLLTKSGIGWLTIIKKILNVRDNNSQWNLDKAKEYYQSIKNYSAEQLKAEEKALMKSLELSDAKLEKLREEGGTALKVEKQYNQLLLEQFRLVNDLRTRNLDTSIFEGGNNKNGDEDEGAIEKREAAIEKMYDDLKYLAEGYTDYRKQQIQKEYEAYLKLTNDTVNAEKWKNEQLKKLQDEAKSFFDDPLEESFQADLEFMDEIIAKDEERTQRQLENQQLIADAQDAERERRRQEEQNIWDDSLSSVYTLGNALQSAFSRSGGTLVSKMLQALQVAIKIANAIKTATAAKAAGSAASGNPLGIITALFSGFGSFFAHSGGEFVGTNRGVRKMASGGSFTVPSGFPNDSYPLRVETGERVSVTPAGDVVRGNAINKIFVSELNNVKSAIYAMNETLMKKNFSPRYMFNVDWLKLVEEFNRNQNSISRSGKNLSDL